MDVTIDARDVELRNTEMDIDLRPNFPSLATQSTGLNRNEVRVGDIVGFMHSNSNREIYGEVIRLNPKTVTINTDETRWRVSYKLLFKVVAPAIESIAIESIGSD